MSPAFCTASGRVIAVELNGGETVETESVISTLPLPLFISMMYPPCPPDVASLAASLSYRSLILVMLMLDRESITQSGTVYFPDPDFPFNRVSEPRNRSGRMSPAGKTSLLAEIPCGHFERNLTLPVPVDMGRIRAVCRNGIVEVRLVKRPLDRVHKISIQGS